MTFGGQTYNEALDGSRLRHQLERVKKYLLDAQGAWVSLQDCPVALEGGGTAAITARARDLRKEKNGAFLVECRRKESPSRKAGYEYRIPWERGAPVRLEVFGRKGAKPTVQILASGLDQLKWAYNTWKAKHGSHASLMDLEKLIEWLES